MSTSTAAPDNLLTAKQAAEYLGITVGGVRAAVRAKSLHPVKLPGVVTVFFTREELDARRQRRQQFVPGNVLGDELAAMQARVNAASGPLLEGWREARKGLTAVAVSAILASQGVNVDPKQLAG